ncbi:RNA polymerase sigma-70 factor, sigma-E family [Pedococcus dokdonensis]|uniref:RNA polymerase sigma-70 factor, sigma-E family n=1 Tax=Pedococcus dokdonensis TaxID=443156 RepID=A0A1H0S0P7_9MICO|nr:SigE family RNA polymerase sigma factor [Pedococcus dokdonensis]SDP35205.1 RNA polymerase sigma-70 factor, sigma-E family [Pedococcus dokdonensis]
MERAAVPPGFDDYVAARGHDLLRTAWLLTGDHQRAEDLVQTALAKVWPHWSRVARDSDGRPDAYVRKVMLTTYFAWWRRRWNAEYPTEVLPEPTNAAGPAPEDVTELRRDLLVALATLPRGQRAAVVLRYFEDLTEAQAAELLGCSVGTIKSQCARAFATLRHSPLLLVDEGARHD